MNYLSVIRVSGEAFDADQAEWRCEDCGCSEYTCKCDAPDPDRQRDDKIERDRLAKEDGDDELSAMFRDLARAKAVFQLRTLALALGLKELPHDR